MARNARTMIIVFLKLTFVFLCRSQFNETNIDFNVFDIKDNRIDFWVDISSFFRYTKDVIIIDYSQNNSCKVYRRDLIDYLNRYNALISIVTFDLNEIEKTVLDLNKNKTVPIADKVVSNTQIIFVFFDTVLNFNNSVSSKKYSPFKVSLGSYFIIIITCVEFEQIQCNSYTFEEDLKTLMGDVFIRLWKKHRALETTIFLPYACDTQTLLKYDPVIINAEKDPIAGVTLLTKEDFSNDPRVILHKYKNLNGYPLEVKMFKRLPTAVKNITPSLMSTYFAKDIEKIDSMSGIDGFVLGNLGKFCNFSIRVSESADGYEYGWSYSNGTFTGTIGDVITRNADISFNARFVKMYGTEDVEFTFPIFHDQFCVLVPKASTIPTWRNIFMGFSMTAWYYILATIGICGFIYWLMKIWSLQRERDSKSNLACCFYFLDSTMLIASMAIFLPTIGRERIFIASCLLFNLIFSAVFQGYLNTAFSTTSYYPDIDTLSALDESGLPIGTSSRLDDIFGTGVSPLLTHLQKKVKMLKFAAIDAAAKNRDVCAVERKTDAILLIEVQHLSEDGTPLLHVVKECPRSYYLSYIVYRGYPFLPVINEFIQRAIEGGLNKLWYEATIYSIILNQRSKNKQSSEALKKLSLVDIQTGFFALAIGLMVSSLVLICEVCFAKIEKRKNKKNRSFDFSAKNVPKYNFVL